MKHTIFLSILVFTCVSLAAQDADMVLTNGNIITLQYKGARAQAVAIKGTEILAAGANESVKKYTGPHTKIIDLQGKTVMPGFNDVHQHPGAVYPFEAEYASLRLDTVTSMGSLIDLLKRKAAIMPKGMLISGYGYNETNLGGQPTRDNLDKATTEHPILISHISGHLAAANSFLLDINGIGENTKDPAGGAFERDKNGRPDGICKESAVNKLHSSTKIIYPPKPAKEEELAGYRLYFNSLLSAGITSIGDAWTTPAKVGIYKALVAEHFPMRFNLLIGVTYLNDVLSGKIARVQDDYLRIAGIKLVHGNSLSGKTCWLNEPYDTINPATGKKDYYGIPPASSQAALDSIVLKIHKAGLQIACHSNGDREIDMVLSAIEKAQQTNYRPGARHRIEHCSITNMEILGRIKKDSIIPVFHCYMYELGEKLKVYGAKRMAMIHPTKTALDMGILFALHSDAPVSSYDAMLRLGSAVNRETKDGTVIGENQKISPEDAISAYTYAGAYTTFEENRKGRIIAGQLADLIVVDSDPTTIDPKKIYAIKVLTTIVGGKIVFEKKQ
jgi:predicted amidohydrolase YtcJ